MITGVLDEEMEWRVASVVGGEGIASVHIQELRQDLGPPGGARAMRPRGDGSE